MRRKVRRKTRKSGEISSAKPEWALRQSIFVFLFMLVFMFIFRVVQKGNNFGASDVAFVFLFALVMAVLELFRKRRADG